MKKKIKKQIKKVVKVFSGNIKNVSKMYSIKKPATKSVQKKGALTTKKIKVRIVKKGEVIRGMNDDSTIRLETPIHDADYWFNRPLDDKHLDWDCLGNWIEGYWQSFAHPHRQLILDVLKEFEPINGLLELGCSCGPNLNLIRRNYGASFNLAGIDVDERSIEMAKDRLRDMDLRVGNITKLPWDTQRYDLILADAVLMYLNKDDLKLALDEVERVARKGVIIVDRFDDSLEGVRNGNVWARNYVDLLQNRGFKVQARKIEKKDWPKAEGWQKFGYIFIGKKEV